jgi:hypothetical protein
MIPAFVDYPSGNRGPFKKFRDLLSENQNELLGRRQHVELKTLLDNIDQFSVKHVA